jgi:hypothetical protein
MQDVTLERLEAFIVQAKAATYVGAGASSPPCRRGSHDLQFRDGDLFYLDSYFGGADFIGQEVVYYQGRPVWGMNYYGRILNPEMIRAAEAGRIIQQSLSAMYREGRFLGGFEYHAGDDVYHDTNQGDVTSFTGSEWIMRQGARVYELVYHGGLIKE